MPEDREFPEVAPARLTPSKIEEWVKRVVPAFSVLARIERAVTWSAQLVAIMMRFDYTPKFELLANPGMVKVDDEGRPEVPAYIDIVNRHTSRELLDDLEAIIALEENESKAEVLTMRDESGQLVEGAVYISDDGRMSYVDHGDEPLDTGTDRGDSWGSW